MSFDGPIPQEIQRGPHFAQGAEGVLYRLSGYPRFLLKVYKQEPNARDIARLDRLIALSAASSLRPCAALPILRTRCDGEAAVVIPLVDDAYEIHELFDRKSRTERFPKSDWFFLTRVAHDFGRVCTAVHDAGLLIVDISEKNVFVRRNGGVVLIDCDSFGFQGGGADGISLVHTPLWIAPELPVRALATTPRTANHDNYAIARLIFMLLFQGSEPMVTPAGQDPAATAERVFAFSRRQMVRAPKPFELTLDEVTPRVATLFEQAFTPQVPGAPPRPTAAEWAAAIGEMAAAMRPCRTVPTHSFLPVTGRPCPWCRMAASGTGFDHFRAVAPSRPTVSGRAAVRPPRRKWGRVAAGLFGALVVLRIAVAGVNYVRTTALPAASHAVGSIGAAVSSTIVEIGNHANYVRTTALPAASHAVGSIGAAVSSTIVEIGNHANYVRTTALPAASHAVDLIGAAVSSTIAEIGTPHPPTLKERTAEFVEAYFRAFNRSGAFEMMDNTYAATVAYFGAQRTHVFVMREKRSILIRWPVRNYMPRTSSFSTVCNQALSRCMTEGVVDFSVEGPDRQNSGVWKYSFTIDFASSLPRIVGEDGASYTDATTPDSRSWGAR